ncbi:hypothetical protein KSF78_0004587 [Schistosoma japonicum]|nr:hypothetical protein KSF78_0004587 [Schistosoma japonicum]
MLFHFNQDRLEEASTIEKTTMLAVSEYNLLIKRSEEKWTARKDLNEVENKLSLNLRDTNEKVSAQIINVKNLLFTAVETANKHRKNENTLVNMIEKAECRRFELCKFLPFEDRIKRLVVTMDKEREICRNCFDPFHFNGVRQLD